MPRRIAITGLGCVGAPGLGSAVQMEALRQGRCHLATRDEPGLPLARRLPVGAVDAALPSAPTRSASLALAAAQEALADLPRPLRRACGLALGSCTGGLVESETAWAADRGADLAAPAYRHQPIWCSQRALAARLRLGGPRSTHSAACASAAVALTEAAEWIRQGCTPLALVIGADALTRTTLDGFHALQLVDPAGCRPLTRGRAGMSLGEGAGALLLEDAGHALARGARPLAWLSGWGLRSEAYHATRPDPEGRELRRAIRDCLADAGLGPEQIGFACLHGTGTRDNDLAEMAALAAELPATVPVAAWKRTWGHCMGACAALEAVGCCLMLQAGERWPSGGARLDIPLGPLPVQTVCERHPVRHLLKTTLAFGGVDACLAFSAA